MVFALATGATGFRHHKAPELPAVDMRPFRGGCHEAARLAGGTVGTFLESAYPGTFHSAVIAAGTDRYKVLCHAVHPWVAVTVDGTGNWAGPGVFVEPPAWAGVFGEMGFVLLRLEVLHAPLTAVDTRALTKAEWAQIHSWRPDNVGQTLFNSWD